MPEIDDGSELEPPLDLFDSRSRTRELVEQLPVVVFVDTDKLRSSTIYITPNVEKVLGHPQASLLEDNEIWFRSIHPDDRDAFWRSWEQAWKGGTPFRAEYRLLRPDGEEVWIRESCVLVRSESGNRLAWQGVVEDLTAEKRAE
ncbi:MAG: PAS domain-containing protein, partial [Actinomycetota bacterium]